MTKAEIEAYKRAVGGSGSGTPINMDKWLQDFAAAAAFRGDPCAPISTLMPAGGERSLLGLDLSMSIYDTIVIDNAAAALRSYTFFDTPVGRADPVTGLAKTKQDTNLKKIGSLGTGEDFRVFSVAIQAVNIDVTFVEFLDLIHKSELWFVIQEVDYFHIPFGWIGTGGGENLVMSTTAGGAFTNDYIYQSIPDPTNLYICETHLVIPANTEFIMRWELGARVAAFAANRKFRIWLNGFGTLPA